MSLLSAGRKTDKYCLVVWRRRLFCKIQPIKFKSAGLLNWFFVLDAATASFASRSFFWRWDRWWQSVQSCSWKKRNEKSWPVWFSRQLCELWLPLIRGLCCYSASTVSPSPTGHRLTQTESHRAPRRVRSQMGRRDGSEMEKIGKMEPFGFSYGQYQGPLRQKMPL